MLIRLQKYMAECGAGARRKCEEMISAGRVNVNGVCVTQAGTKVDPDISIVTLDGQALSVPKKIYLALNKPLGYITSAKDQFGRPTVVDLIGESARLFPVGRLDYDTSGLLFITNDGDFAYKLTHPKHRIEKKYLAALEGTPSKSSLDVLRAGVTLQDGPCAPCSVCFANDSERSLIISISEGRNRQVRRMFEAVGHKVLSLKRLAIGGIDLGGLTPGEYRHLTEEEVELFIREGKR